MNMPLIGGDNRPRYSRPARETILAEARRLGFDDSHPPVARQPQRPCPECGHPAYAWGTLLDEKRSGWSYRCLSCNHTFEVQSEQDAGWQYERLRLHLHQVERAVQNLSEARRQAKQAFRDEVGPQLAGAAFRDFVIDFDEASNCGEAGMPYAQAVEHRRRALEAARDFGSADSLPWLLLGGPPGRGKTMLVAARLAKHMRRSARQGEVNVIPLRTEAAYCRQWKTASDHRFDREWDGPSPDEIVEEMATCGCLILDDFGDGNPSPGWLAVVTEVLGERYRHGRHTIVTTNQTPQQVAARYGEKIASRMLDRGVCVQHAVPGPDFRLQRLPQTWAA